MSGLVEARMAAMAAGEAAIGEVPLISTGEERIEPTAPEAPFVWSEDGTKLPIVKTGDEAAFNTIIPATSDARTVNNSMRSTYRVLSDAEKAQMTALKDCGAEFVRLLHAVGETDPLGDKFSSRDLSLANTHMEDAVMRAVRHVTK